jgi:hypothetical protein
MQTMDSNLAQLVRNGTITKSLAEQRSTVPEELKRLLGGSPTAGPGEAEIVDVGETQQPAPPAGAPVAPATMM